MAVHVEFVVLGPPISNQQSTAQGKANLTGWRATVAGEVQNRYANSLLTGPLKANIINFHEGSKPSAERQAQQSASARRLGSVGRWMPCQDHGL